MPHKPSQGRADQVQFVSVSLTVELKHVLANWAADNDQSVFALMIEAVNSGYRVTVKEESEGSSASMAYLRTTGVNKGLVLMERGSTPERALKRLLWAHYSHFKLVWPRERASPEDDW